MRDLDELALLGRSHPSDLNLPLGSALLTWLIGSSQRGGALSANQSEAVDDSCIDGQIMIGIICVSFINGAAAAIQSEFSAKSCDKTHAMTRYAIALRLPKLKQSPRASQILRNLGEAHKSPGESSENLTARSLELPGIRENPENLDDFGNIMPRSRSLARLARIFKTALNHKRPQEIMRIEKIYEKPLRNARGAIIIEEAQQNHEQHLTHPKSSCKAMTNLCEISKISAKSPKSQKSFRKSEKF